MAGKRENEGVLELTLTLWANHDGGTVESCLAFYSKPGT